MLEELEASRSDLVNTCTSLSKPSFWHHSGTLPWVTLACEDSVSIFGWDSVELCVEGWATEKCFWFWFESGCWDSIWRFAELSLLPSFAFSDRSSIRLSVWFSVWVEFVVWLFPGGNPKEGAWDEITFSCVEMTASWCCCGWELSWSCELVNCSGLSTLSLLDCAGSLSTVRRTMLSSKEKVMMVRSISKKRGTVRTRWMGWLSN